MAVDVFRQTIGGAGSHVVVMDEDGNKIIGRGQNITWTDTIEQLPVDEYGVTGIREYVTGRHMGTGTLGLMSTPEINSQLAYQTAEDGFSAIGPFTFKEVIAPNRPGAGKVINTFFGVKITQVSGNFAAAGLVGRGVNFVYTERVPGDGTQDANEGYYNS